MIKLINKPLGMKAFRESCKLLEQDDMTSFIFALSDHTEQYAYRLDVAKDRYTKLLDYKPYLKGNSVILENLRRLEIDIAIMEKPL